MAICRRTHIALSLRLHRRSPEAAIRQQTAIDDTQFLQSMIPHHSGAILMCREAQITDARIADLCDEIIAGQQEEIERMRGILRE